MTREQPNTAATPQGHLEEHFVRRPSRWLRCFSWMTWLVGVIAFGTFFYLWRTYQWPPDYRWVLGLGAALAITTLLLIAFAGWRILRGPDRFGAICGLVIGLIPSLFWPTYFAEIYWRAESRQSIPGPWLTGPIAMVASNIADAEVAYRYPRKEVGEHVTLIDQGDPENARALVDSMESHIQSLCRILKSDLHRPVYWVRGGLLGTRGKSFAGWAICDSSIDSKVNQLDRHEVAHAVIHLMSEPTTHPPTLLVEGWAEYQSLEPEALHREMQRALEEGNLVTDIDELVSNSMYGRSILPMYVVGGTFVQYLIETFGGEKFFALYRDTSQERFKFDFERHMGQSWKACKLDFEQWLKTKVPVQAKAIVDSNAIDSKLEFLNHIVLAKDVDAEDWANFVARSKEFYSKRQFVDSVSLGWELWKTETSVQEEDTLPPRKSKESVRILLDDRQAWMGVQGRAESLAIVAAQGLNFEAHRQVGMIQRSGRVVHSPKDRKRLRTMVEDRLREHQLTGDWLHWMVRQESNHPHWEVVALRDLGDWIEMELDNGKEDRFFAKVDTRKDMQMLEARWTKSSGDYHEWNYRYEYSNALWAIEHWEENQIEGNAMTVALGDVEPLKESQQRSFLDELRSIEVADSNDTPDLPWWLLGWRMGMVAWSLMAVVCAFLFALFRL